MIEEFRISIIAALSQNNVIGINNKLPWNIKEDSKYFKEVTLYKSIIMGRKTFESIGRALPDRDNIVITSNKDFSAKKIQTANCLEVALYKAKCNDVFIIGGERIYKEALGFADFLYLTRIDKDYDGDEYHGGW